MKTLTYIMCIPDSGIFGIQEEGLFIFRELGSAGNYFRGASEQARLIASVLRNKTIIV